MGSITRTIANNLNVGHGNGKIAKISYANPSNYNTNLAYNSTSLTPCGQITVTAAFANSHFLITWSAEHYRSGNGRSQWLLADAYTAGENNYNETRYLMYSHYGLSHTASAFNQITSFSYYDTSQSLSVGGTVTYYTFLGIIGSGTEDGATNQRFQVMEIAQ